MQTSSNFWTTYPYCDAYEGFLGANVPNLDADVIGVQRRIDKDEVR
jgi:hypothetical protein